MRTYSDLPVYKASYDLLLLVYEFSNPLSRDYKYTIGERLKSETLELLLLVFKSSTTGIYDICIDKENILWVATYGGGVNFFNSNQLLVTNIQHEINNTNSIIANFTRAIAKDNKSKFWFGTKLLLLKCIKYGLNILSF